VSAHRLRIEVTVEGDPTTVDPWDVADVLLDDVTDQNVRHELERLGITSATFADAEWADR